MKIAVNFRMVTKKNRAGISFFTTENFQRIAKAHPEHTFYFLFDEKPDNQYIISSNIVPIRVPMKVRFRAPLLWFWYEIVLPRTLRKIKPDIYISPDSLMPLSIQIPSMIVIHDLNFEHYPVFLPKKIVKFYKKYIPLYLNKAFAIAAVSEFTKNDIIQTYGIDENKINVVYSGYNGGFVPIPVEKKYEVLKKYAGGCPFFIFTGSIHPRKNLINQLRAFDLFRKQNPLSNHKFLIVGISWIWRKEDERAFNSLTFKEDIVFLGRFPDKELKEVTASAEAMMYVSVFEGFGLPILEGFYSEIPVITANASSMPEIARDAAACVDPFNPQEIADSMSKIVNDLDFRNQLVHRGIERRTEFSWDKTAELLWHSIEKVINLKLKREEVSS